MGLKIYWTEFSQKELKKIFKYYRETAGIRIAKKLVDGIYNETLVLKKQLKIGQVEDFLENRKEEFRNLVFKNYKIIYWINDKHNRIEINDVFDTTKSSKN